MPRPSHIVVLSGRAVHGRRFLATVDWPEAAGFLLMFREVIRCRAQPDLPKMSVLKDRLTQDRRVRRPVAAGISHRQRLQLSET